MMIQFIVRIYGFKWTVPRPKAFSGSSAWPWLFLPQKIEGLGDGRHSLITILQLKDAPRLFACPWHNAPLLLIQPLTISEWSWALLRQIVSASLHPLSDNSLSVFRHSLLFHRNLLHKWLACCTSNLENPTWHRYKKLYWINLIRFTKH